MGRITEAVRVFRLKSLRYSNNEWFRATEIGGPRAFSIRLGIEPL